MLVETARSWTDLQELLFEGSWNRALGRHRSPYAFRGMARADYPLDTSLMRLGGDFPALEQHLLRNFQKYAHRDVVERNTPWHWLSLAQHHGLPTRLLDWTYSPLVGMHFATADPDAFAEDGAIWAVDFEAVHRRLPGPLRSLLAAERANAFTPEMLAARVDPVWALEELSEEPFLLFFEPPSMDERIVNQFALFSVMSDPRLGLGDWLEQRPEVCRKVVVPAAVKWEVRDKLDQCNVTERVLFPGLDGLSDWLKRHYAPRAPEAAAEPGDVLGGAAGSAAGAADALRGAEGKGTESDPARRPPHRDPG